MNRYILLVALLFLINPVFAQVDSVALVNAHWKQKKLVEGVVWKRTHLNQKQLFGANQYFSVVQISKNAPKAKLALGYSDSLENTSTIAKRYHALAGINGSFFKMKGSDPDHQPTNKSNSSTVSKHIGNRSIVYLRVADSLITQNIFARDSIRRRHQQGIITITGGELSILNTICTNLHWEHNISSENIIATGPVMLLEGKEQPIPDDAFCRDRHPRTAVGKMADGTVLLVTVDGRTPESAGMSIVELMRVMRWLGCREAINLDGGGSTTMFVAGQPENGVVNHPSDNKRFDASGERAVANALLVLVNKNKP